MSAQLARRTGTAGALVAAAGVALVAGAWPALAAGPAAEPTPESSVQPSVQPSTQPAEEPTAEPAVEPALDGAVDVAVERPARGRSSTAGIGPGRQRDLVQQPTAEPSAEPSAGTQQPLTVAAAPVVGPPTGIESEAERGGGTGPDKGTGKGRAAEPTRSVAPAAPVASPAGQPSPVSDPHGPAESQGHGQDEGRGHGQGEGKGQGPGPGQAHPAPVDGGSRAPAAPAPAASAPAGPAHRGPVAAPRSLRPVVGPAVGPAVPVAGPASVMGPHVPRTGAPSALATAGTRAGRPQVAAADPAPLRPTGAEPIVLPAAVEQRPVPVELGTALPIVAAKTAAAVASTPEWPLGIVGVVVVFLLVQNRVDRRDPKLAQVRLEDEAPLEFAPFAGGSSVQLAAR